MIAEEILSKNELISVLYVDDEPILLKYGKIFLEKNGELEVTTCDNTDDAVRLISEKPLDAVIYDIQMTGCDDTSFLRHIHERGDDTPVIIYSGNKNKDLIIEALNSGADYYLEKGRNPKDQFAKISEKIIHLTDKKISRALTQSFFNTQNDLMFIKDENFRYITANEAYLRFLRISHEELINKSDNDLMEPDFTHHCLESDKKVLLTGKTVVSEETYSGHVYRTIKFPVKTAHNRRGVAGIIRDISGRKNTCNKLRNIENLNRHIIEAIPDIFIQCRGDGTLTDIRIHNNNYHTALGKEYLEKSITEAVPGEPGILLMEKIRLTLEKDRIEKIEYPVETPEGLSYYEAQIIPYLKDETVTLIRDITALRKNEEELKIKNKKLAAAREELRSQIEKLMQAQKKLEDNEEYIRAILDNIPLGIAVNSVRPEVEYEYFNENFLKYYRISAKPPEGEDSLRNTIYEDPILKENIKGKILADCKSGEPERMHREEVPITRAGEETTYISTRNIPLGKEGLFISIVRDVTEEKRSKDQIRLHLSHVKSLLGLHQIAGESEEDILNYALENILSVTESRYGFIGTISPDGTEISINKWSADVMEEGQVYDRTLHFSVGEGGVLTECIRKRAPLVINDFLSYYPEKQGFPKGHVEITRFLAVPIFEGDKIAAVIAAANKETDYRDDDIDAITGLGNMMWEIFRNKRSQAKLEESESRLRAIIDNLPRGVVQIIDRDLCYVFSAGPEIVRTGFSDNFLSGKSIYDVLDAENAEKIGSALTSVFERGENVITDGRYSGQDFLVQMAPLREPDGKITRVLVLSINVTTEKEAENNFRKQKELFRRTFESLHDAAFVLGVKPEKILAVNKAALSLFGYSKEEMLGQTTDFLRPDMVSPESYYRHITPYLLNKKNIPGFEFQMIKKDGTLFLTEHLVTPLQNSGGELAGWVFIIRDITEKKDMERRERSAIVQIEENMEQLATLNDQIRNPLAVISGTVEIKCPDIADDVLEQINMIDEIVAKLDAGWVRSEKIWGYLKEHYGTGDESMEMKR